MNEPSKCLLVPDVTKISDIRRAFDLGPEWMVVGVHAAIAGRRFDLMVVVMPDSDDTARRVRENAITCLIVGGEYLEI